MAEHEVSSRPPHVAHPPAPSEAGARHEGHQPTRKPYFLTFGFLIIMTALTVLVAEFNLGPLNDVVALTIAVLKGTAVVLFFMHVRHSSRLTKLTVVSGFVWLAFMIFITLSDYLTRGWFHTTYSGP